MKAELLRERKEKGFMSACLDFCKQNEAITTFRRATGRCSEIERPDESVGSRGTGPCYLMDIPVDDMCNSCRTRSANFAAWKAATKDRSRAKTRMLYWYRKP